MTLRTLATLALLMAAAPALAQPSRPSSGFDDVGPQAGQQGFSFQGDELPRSYDRKPFGQYDDRYSQTYHEQQTQVQKPGGGCLKYGTVGAIGGHYAGHTVLGAVGGCILGHMVRNRDKAQIDSQQPGR